MIRFCDPPKDDFEAPQLYRVKGVKPIQCLLLNDKYVGLDTHFWGGHTIACPGSDTCRACGEGLVAVWGGFIFAQTWERGKVTVLALTPVMAAMLLSNVEDSRGLLGMKVTFRRKTEAANSGVLTNFHGWATDFDGQTQERLVARVRIIFKDYVIDQLKPIHARSGHSTN